MKHCNKIRLFNPVYNTYLYPDSSGHFYVHRVNKMLVWDKVENWPEDFVCWLTPCALQQTCGNIDSNGDEIYQGDLKLLQVFHPAFFN